MFSLCSAHTLRQALRVVGWVGQVVACCACFVEGFTDLLFMTLQFSRPNGGGNFTGGAALFLTVFSTAMHMSPPGKGSVITAMVVKDMMS